MMAKQNGYHKSGDYAGLWQSSPGIIFTRAALHVQLKPQINAGDDQWDWIDHWSRPSRRGEDYEAIEDIMYFMAW